GRRTHTSADAVSATADATAFTRSITGAFARSDSTTGARPDSAAGARAVRRWTQLGQRIAPDRHIVIRQLHVGRTNQGRIHQQLGIGIIHDRGRRYELSW